MPTTPLLALPYPALADTPDVPRDVRALALAIDNAQIGWRVGDFKASFQTADHTGWVLADGLPRVRASYPAAYTAMMDSVLTAHPDPTKVRTPNAKRRNFMGADPAGALLGGVVPNLGSLGGEELHALLSGESGRPAVAVNINIPATYSPPDGENAGMYHRPGGNQVAKGDNGTFGAAINVAQNIAAADAVSSHNNVGPYLAVNIFVATGGAGGGPGGGVGTGALVPPTDVPLVTANLAAGAGESGIINIGAGYRILKVTSDRLARVRLYSTPAKRTSDVARPVTVEPPDYPSIGSAPNHGCMMELNYVAANLVGASYIQDLSPNVVGSSGETPRTNNIAYRVDNTDTVARVITLSITVQVLETA